MPIVETKEVIPKRHLAIWYVSETFDEMFEMLQPNEQDTLLVKSFRYERKKLEWLAGRLALKFLCGKLGLRYKGILKNSVGKPFLTGFDHEISLTHSFPHVAAIIDPKYDVGIDLEQPKEKIVRIAPKFLNDKELVFCGDNHIMCTLLWSAKETLYKIHSRKGLSFKENLEVSPFTLEDKTFKASIITNVKTRFNLAFSINDPFVLTYNI